VILRLLSRCHTDRQMDGLTDKTDRQTDGQTRRQTDRQTDGWIMDGWTDRQTD